MMLVKALKIGFPNCVVWSLGVKQVLEGVESKEEVISVGRCWRSKGFEFPNSSALK